MNNCDKCIYNDAGSMQGHPCGLTEYPDVDMQGNCADFEEAELHQRRAPYVVGVNISCNACITVFADNYNHASIEAVKHLADAIEISFDDKKVDDVSFPCFCVVDVERIGI